VLTEKGASTPPKPVRLKPWIALAPLAAWCLLIFALSSVPGNKYPQVQWEHADKLMHVLLYFWVGVFALLYFRSLGAGPLSAVLFGIIYGLSDEVHQLLVPRRSFSLYDWGADSVGAILGVASVLLWHYWNYSNGNVTTSNNQQSAERMEAS
jgi:VanZ family protein